MTAPEAKTIELLDKLIAFDTVSERSNRDLIEFVRDFLADHGVESQVFNNESGTKANLLATIGRGNGGLMLAGHSDVVPVDGQDWSSDPFTMTKRDEKLFGRGTCDMKGFLAVALSLVPEIVQREAKAPVHLAFTYDEEIGCFGAAELASQLAAMPARPSFAIIGEPTSMQVVNGHKGKLSVDCRVRGAQCHSAFVDDGVNAVEVAARLIARLGDMQRDAKNSGPIDDRFAPPFTTIHTGLVAGGVARNIVPGDCRFEFEVRNLPGVDPMDVLRELEAYAKSDLLPAMYAVETATAIEFDLQSNIPALTPRDEDPFERRVLAVAGTNRPGKVSFATEAGLYQESGIATIVCGPGDIAKAHKADEFVSLDQLAKCESFLRQVVATFD